ncbi:hypothetical protein [Flavivirga sp. 57AJ16]|uniref:hypothetical protein n=1 Tax=Flavivirga sp. 57AJ16 TaxID=3025307 RepID=UPI0023660E40|nr:hypothetical protein [Flavivirga sp. 57AJ16]MDD7886219.1 hypothetical protein [Flavivirga sp. 57AJ16]
MTVKIAKILSAYLIITGIGFLISGEFYETLISHKATNPILINLSGMVHFFIGMIILVIHCKWKNILQILVSSLGFMFFIKGVLLIVIPELILQTGDNAMQKPWLMSLGFISVGIIMEYLIFKEKKQFN